MFTGLIESVGEVAEVAAIDAGFSLRIASDIAARPAPRRERRRERRLSDGRRTRRPGAFSAEIGPETAKVTSLGGSEVRIARESRARDAPQTAGSAATWCSAMSTERARYSPIRPEADFSWVTVSYPAGARAVSDSSRIDCRRRHQPDDCEAREDDVRRADCSVHLVAHEPARRRAPAIASTSNATWSASTCFARNGVPDGATGLTERV